METNQHRQYRILILLLLTMAGAIGVLSFSDPVFFQRFMGRVNPLVVMLLSGGAGSLMLAILLSKKWFAIYQQVRLGGLLPYLALVACFAAVAIFIDWKIILPADINLLFPRSLLFYPAIAFLVEMLFHVLPLSLLLFLLLFFFRKTDREKLVWGSILIVAALEPTYQVFFTTLDATWAVVLLWINLYLFNVTQLFVFKKFDFISMYLLRIGYYTIWHIIWGHFRLDVLF